MIDRRVFVGGLAAWGCTPRLPAIDGTLLSTQLEQRAHRLRTPAPAALGDERCEVAIVGLGVAGLSAAWALRRAGFGGRVRLFDLADRPGGTSVSDRGAPVGAHYVTMASPEARAYRALLDDLGVITGWRGGRPRYDPRAICPAPQERLHDLGRWSEGLWPEQRATEADRAERDDFLDVVAQARRAIGADGKPAFSIPIAESSRDPAWRDLARTSFAAWLSGRGYRSAVVRWWLEYGCRDDYGTTLEETSAWAGLHYHASRRPDPADDLDLGTDLLTWPDGNDHLVRLLVARLPWPVTSGALVRAVEPGPPVRLVVEQGADARLVTADAVILAVPSFVVDRLLGRAPRSTALELTPWRVATVQLDATPDAFGLRAAWDSVIYGADSLGTVSSAHVEGRFTGPTTLTWYEPWLGPPLEQRRALLTSSLEGATDRVLTELSAVHPNLRRSVRRVDVMRWGHGTARPIVGLHADDTLDLAAAPVGGVYPAHTDLSGISLFEEASYHGIRAAEAVLTASGSPFDPLTG